MIRSLVAAAVVVGVAAVLFLGEHGRPNVVEPLAPAPPLRSLPAIVPSTVPAPRYVVTAHRPLPLRVPFLPSTPTLAPRPTRVTVRRSTPKAIVIPRVRDTTAPSIAKPKQRQVPTPPTPPKQTPTAPTKPTAPTTPTVPTRTPSPNSTPPVAAPSPVPPEREPATTPPPVTTPPVTQPPVTQPPVTQPPSPQPDPVTTRPGNGYGDRNHEHNGPPGQTKKDK